MARRDTDPTPPPGGLPQALPLLLLAAGPLLLPLLTGGPGALVTAILHFALLVGAALVIGAGHDAARRSHVAEAASRPAIPSKLLGAGLIGVVVFLLAADQVAPLTAFLLGLSGTGFSVAAFGTDPLDDLRPAAPEHAGHGADRLLAEADAALRDVVDRVAALDAPDLARRAEALHGTVLQCLRERAADAGRFHALDRTTGRCVRTAAAAAARLQRDWGGDRRAAASRFAARLAAITASFESGAALRRDRASKTRATGAAPMTGRSPRPAA